MSVSYQPRGLQRLLDAGSERTLGEIAYASNGDWKWKQGWLFHHRPPDAEEQRWELWRGYDDAFSSRPDYKLWRNVFRGEYLPDPLDAAGIIDVAHRGLTSRPLVVWGTLAGLSGLLGSGSRAAALSSEQMIEVASLCSNRIADNLAPLSGATYACAAIRLLLRSAIERSWFVGVDSNCYSTVETATEFLNTVESLMRQIDPTWRPGLTVTIDKLFLPRVRDSVPTDHSVQRDSRPLLTFNTFEFARQLRVVFFRARGVVRNLSPACSVDTHVMDLLQRAFQYSMSAWLSARSLRMSEEQRVSNKPGWYSKGGLDRMRQEEVKALCRAGLAAKDAGRFSTAATLSHHLLWTIPDERTAEHWNWFRPEHFAYDVRQLGLEVPARFHRTKQPRLPRSATANAPAKVAETPIIPDDVSAVDTTSVLQGDAENNDGVNPLRMRLVRDQATDRLWAKVIAALPADVPSDPLKLLGSLVYLARRKTIIDPEVLRSAFHLCLRYKQITDAGTLLDTHQFELRKADVIRFADAISAAGTLLPWAIDLDRHRQWQGILRGRWGKLASNAVSATESFDIHEALLGRLVTTMRSANSATLDAKYYGTLTEFEIAELYDAGGETRRQGRSTVSLPDVQSCLRTLSTPAMGTPIAVSVTWLMDQLWSVTVIPAQGEAICERISFNQNLREEASAISNSPELHLGVPWEDGLLSLGTTVRQLASKCDPCAQWILLAVEPNLATLPWQDLLGSCDDAEPPLISLVPSLTWAVIASREQHQYSTPYTRFSSIAKLMEPHLERSLSKQQLDAIGRQYAELLSELNRFACLPALRESSVTFVLGHGLWDNAARWVSVIAPDQPMSREDWAEAAARRIVVVHACSGGRVKHQFLGDVGGLAALALGRRARIFAAPVAEIPPSTALAFQREIVQSNSAHSFGERYMNAVRADRSVALYNLWGFASEPFP